MDINLVKVTLKEKEILWRLLQFGLYDGSFYIDNEINEEGVFPYDWFNNYFSDMDRAAYFIKSENKILGYAMVNANLKTEHDCQAQTIAEFLVMPQYRKNHIGKKAAYMIFDMYDGEFEVEPIENSNEAYNFWNSIIKEYSDGEYKNIKLEADKNMFVFKSNRNKIKTL